MTKRVGTISARHLVESVLKDRRVNESVRAHRLQTHWQEVVGSRAAEKTSPEKLHHGTLYVRVANSSWLHELAFQQKEWILKANQLCGDPPLVHSIRFYSDGQEIDQK